METSIHVGILKYERGMTQKVDFFPCHLAFTIANHVLGAARHVENEAAR
jgi:hypothetical protein